MREYVFVVVWENMVFGFGEKSAILLFGGKMRVNSFGEKIYFWHENTLTENIFFLILIGK